MSARNAKSQREQLIAEYHRKWREESQSWAEFEGMTGEGLEVSNATLGRGSDAVALQLGLLVGGDDYVEAHVRGEEIMLYIGERNVTPEEFVTAGEAYWDAFEKELRGLTSAERLLLRNPHLISDRTCPDRLR